MSATQTRWSLVVSSETDTSLRQFLANNGGGRKGDLSRFVEEAVQERIFELTVQAIKEQNASKTEVEIEEIVEEALAWARKQ
jgi:Ribbon-helix-helix domain